MMKKTATQITNRISMIMVTVFITCMFLYFKMEKTMDNNLLVAKKEYHDSLRVIVNTKDSIIFVTERKLNQLYKLNWDNIDYWIRFYNIEHGDIVKRQIYLETGNLTSTICVDNKNLFGMKFPGNGRITTARGKRNGHAYFENYIESIHDYALWQQERFEDITEDYYAFLVRIGYAEDKQYIRLLKSIPDSAFTH